MKNSRTLAMAQVALLGAIILILAFTPGIGYIPLGVTRATIIHIPVIVGAILLGPKKGALLGFLFGLTSFINNTINPTVTSFTFTPFYNGGNFWSLVICFVPRILVGVVPYFVYKGLKLIGNKLSKKEGGTIRTFFAKLFGTNPFPLAVAGLAGSLTNTVLVMSLIGICFGKAYSAAKDILPDALWGVIMGVVGVNGVPEAILAAVLTSAIAGALLRFLGKKAPKTSA